MNSSVTEIYNPREVTDLGIWQIEGLNFKVYAIIADGQMMSEELLSEAKSFVVDQVPELVAKEGHDNGLGFVIIHPGEFGVSILAHWWIHGSVLCQHIRRRIWDQDKPMDTQTRPVIACIWELGLINAEQEIWRKTMMGVKPDPSVYLETRATLKVV